VDHTTNHKDIGTLYLWLSLLMFGVGGIMAVVDPRRAVLAGLQFVDPDFFNQLTTMHGLIMISARSCRPSSLRELADPDD